MIDVVVAYDRATARLLEQFIFSDDPTTAFAKRLERERAFRKSPNIEVVLVSARSIEDLKISHARYFDPKSISADRLKLLSEDVTGRLAS